MFGSPVDLSVRHFRPEWMDDAGLDVAEHRRALAGLARINRISGVAGRMWGQIRPFAMRRPGLRVLDLACGGGDVAIAIKRLAERAGLKVTVHGCDVSEVALDHARQQAGADEVVLFRLNALRDVLPAEYDVVVSCLFLHHLDLGDVVALLRRMARCARQCVLVSDLHRSVLGLLAAWAGTRLLSRSRVVHHDGVASVRAAFTIGEMTQMAHEAGLRDARLRAAWPWRWLLRWDRP